MNYVTKNLAAQIESCIKKTHIEVTNTYLNGTILEIGGGVACFSGFDSYLSQVVGWGFQTNAKQLTSEIAIIEEFYKSIRHQRVDIELCPFVGNELAVFLGQRGYQLSELNNVSVLNLNHYHVPTFEDNSLVIREIQKNELQEWAKKVALGFAAPEAQEQFYHYAKAQGVRVFAAFKGNELVAGATLAIHDDFCDLGVTSTLPAYRGQGLQKKLVHARLMAAKQQGATTATVTTEPGSISDCNVQKTGFHCAYTRIKMSLVPVKKDKRWV